MPIRLDLARPIDPTNLPTRPQAMPHGDAMLWTRWAPAIANQIARLWADVPMTPDDNEPPLDDPTRRAWWRATAKRADAIAQTHAGTWWIIELHLGDPAEAIGRLAAYIATWYADPKFRTLDMVPILVTNTLDLAHQRSAARHGILYWHVPTPPTTPPPNAQPRAT